MIVFHYFFFPVDLRKSKLARANTAKNNFPLRQFTSAYVPIVLQILKGRSLPIT